MNKKMIAAFAVAAMTSLAMARPGPGGFGGPRGGFHGGPRGGVHHGGFAHRGGFHGGYRPGGYHHHHHRGWGWGLGAAGLALGTAAVVRDMVAPRTVVYSCGAPVAYATYPYSTTCVVPAAYPATTVYAPAVTYGVPATTVVRW